MNRLEIIYVIFLSLWNSLNAQQNQLNNFILNDNYYVFNQDTFLYKNSLKDDCIKNFEKIIKEKPIKKKQKGFVNYQYCFASNGLIMTYTSKKSCLLIDITLILNKSTYPIFKNLESYKGNFSILGFNLNNKTTLKEVLNINELKKYYNYKSQSNSITLKLENISYCVFFNSNSDSSTITNIQITF